MLGASDGGMSGDDPTIQPSLGVIMYTEFNVGGATSGAVPNIEGARVMCVHANPSQ